MYEAFKLVITSFVLPPGGPLVLLGLGLLAWRYRPRLALVLCSIAAFFLWLASTPIVAAALVTALGGAQPLNIDEAKTADAIVILGGGVRPQALEYGGDTLGRLTLERTRYGAFLAKRTGLPVLVTGGSPDANTRPEAELMREALEREYAVPVRWADSRAGNTRESAANAARVLIGEGKRGVVLVMHGFDVWRAKRLFEAAGLQVMAAPTQLPRWDKLSLRDLLPNVMALQTSHYALYELAGLARDAVSADW